MLATPRGPEIVRYLEREADGKIVFAMVPANRDELLTAGKLRRLCDKLRLPKERFGVTEGSGVAGGAEAESDDEPQE